MLHFEEGQRTDLVEESCQMAKDFPVQVVPERRV